MTGHVFHPGHDELHGITVIVEAVDGRTLVGRWHEHGEKGVLLRDVAVHDPEKTKGDVEEWLSQLRKFGVPSQMKHAIVPTDQFLGVRRFDQQE